MTQHLNALTMCATALTMLHPHDAPEIEEPQFPNHSQLYATQADKTELAYTWNCNNDRSYKVVITQKFRYERNAQGGFVRYLDFELGTAHLNGTPVAWRKLDKASAVLANASALQFIAGGCFPDRAELKMGILPDGATASSFVEARFETIR